MHRRKGAVVTRQTMDAIKQASLPFARLMGVVLTRVEPELVEAEMVARDDLCTLPPVLHGGAVMALADSLGGIGATLNLPPDAAGTTTIESKTNFIAAAKCGSTVIARATPVHRGRRTQIWQTRVTTEAGRLLAVTHQTQLVL
jgi:uncharacterized protein (TIGR00369 family)